jgi:hypothetical protein
MNMAQDPQSMHHRVEQGAQHAGPRDLEFTSASQRRYPSPIGARVMKIARLLR